MRPSLANLPKPKALMAACVAWWPVGILLLLVGALSLLAAMKMETVAAARNSQRKEGPPPLNVVTLELAPSPIKDRITLPGEAVANRELTVPAEVSAILVRKTRKEGDAVRQGEILAELDPALYASREKAAKEAFEAARATKERLENLNQTSLATQSELDRALAGLEEARNGLTAARLDRSKCTIKAPFSGYLDAYLVEQGAFATPGTPVCRLMDIDSVKIRVGVPESDVNTVRNPASFSVVIEALGASPLPSGTLSSLTRSAGTTARLYDLEFLFPNAGKRILPGMFARVELVKAIRNQALVIPIYAVISRENRHMVYVEEKGEARVRQVAIGIQEGWMVEVTDGLAIGDRVIVVGQRSVSEGRKVTVVRNARRVEDLHP